ncbi:MAG: response regulator [Prevotella sp.]|nr:response regulator [Prevotella sp.]
MFFAGNGNEGLEKARELVPDLIITDIMMPGMDGFELCRQVRKDTLLSHIPVIMVTAKATQEDRMDGLNAGADAYLEKPFRADELNLRVEKLLEQRRLLMEKYSNAVAEEKTEEIVIKSADQEFLDRFHEELYIQLKQQNLDFNQLAAAFCITRVQLNRKLKAITGLSTRDYINTLRINRAKRLLRDNEFTIGEIAMKLGIDDIAYFSRFFKKETGVTPTEYRRQQGS